MVLEVNNVAIDNIVMIVSNVTDEQFDNFVWELDKKRVLFSVVNIVDYTSNSLSDYRYHIHISIDGDTEGAIHISYMHNSSSNDTYHDLRIEFNPNKRLKYYDKRGVLHDVLRDVMQMIVSNFNRLADSRKKRMKIEDGRANVFKLRELDIAFDVKCDIDDLVCIPSGKRKKNVVDGTLYFGRKHRNAYVKIYDKKEERLKQLTKKRERLLKNKLEYDDVKNIDYNCMINILCDEIEKYEHYESLTRIEYTVRLDDVRINDFVRNYRKKKTLEIDDNYTISIIDYEKCDSATKAHLLCYMHNLMTLSDMSRRYKEKVRKAISEMDTISLDDVLYKNIDVIESIKELI